ncbi:hypothetical protein ACJX0J_011769, partial [Zea mays]
MGLCFTFLYVIVFYFDLDGVRKRTENELMNFSVIKLFHRYFSAGMFFLSFPCLLPLFVFLCVYFYKCDGFQPCEVNELKTGTHYFDSEYQEEDDIGINVDV